MILFRDTSQYNSKFSPISVNNRFIISEIQRISFYHQIKEHNSAKPQENNKCTYKISTSVKFYPKQMILLR